MILFKSLSITMVVLFSIYFSINDIKRNKIDNKWIIFGLIGGIIANIIYIVIGGIDRDIIIHYMINIFFGSVISIFLYALHIWAGGDAKLFIMMLIMLPISSYIFDGVTSVIIIYLIAFSISFCYLIIDSVIKSLQDIERCNTSFSINFLFIMLKNILFVSGGISIINFVLKFILKDFYFDNY